jgi:Secretion system C-terminal sorting domain
MTCDYQDCFQQIEGNIYWLVIEIATELETIGWKSSLDQFMDDAVYWSAALGNWYPLPYLSLHQPYDTNLDLAFVVNGQEQCLPVELSSFTAEYSSGELSVRWATQSETDNIGWNIYRSENFDFSESIKTNNQIIPGAETTSEQTDYVFTDQFEAQANNTYYYWIESMDLSGITELYGPVAINITEEPDNPIPPSNIIVGLHQNYPNPFNPNTEIKFAIEEAGIAELTIYNIKGQKVITLYNAQTNANEYISVEWDGKDLYQKSVASGIYMYKLKTAKTTFMKRMLLVK